MKWVELSGRFRKLSEVAGEDKTGSFDLTVDFRGPTGLIDVCLFTWDIKGWDKRTYLTGFGTDEEAKAATLKKIEEAERAVGGNET